MTLSTPVAVSGSSGADVLQYLTASIPASTGELVLVIVTSGKGGNASAVPTSVTQTGGIGGLTLVGSQAVPNNNQTVSVWKGVTVGSTAGFTIQHSVVMDNCAWHVVRFASTVATPTVRQFDSVNGAAAGTISVPLDNPPLAGSCMVGAIGVNAGNTSTPSVGAGFTQLGAQLYVTSPTVQQMLEYDNTDPLSTVSWTFSGTNGRSMIALEIADGVVAPPTQTMTLLEGGVEIPVELSWWDGTTETPIVEWSG